MEKFKKLYKKTKLNQIQEWQIVAFENSYWTEEGIQNGKITKSIPVFCQGKNEGKKNGTTPEQQAYKEALSRWKKRKENGYYEDVKDIHEGVIHFEPMLAKKYQDEKNSVVFPVYSQPKLDGMRCIVNKDGMFSRNGKPIVSAPHIYKAFCGIFQLHPDLIFDGELYADKFKDDFNKIMSLAKKTKPTEADLEESKQLLQYHIYDIPSVTGTFGPRFWVAAAMLIDYKILEHVCIKLVSTNLVETQEQLDVLYGEYLEAGYEGQMVRLNDRPYENERTTQLLKRKEFIDEEYEIKDILEGKGNRSGMAGRMVFQKEDGREFHSNIKGGFDYYRELLENKQQYIGKQATIRYFNLTPDGIPRFPFVVAIRDYE